MMDFIFENVVCSFVGTMAFSVLFNVPKRYYFWCGMTGTIGWLVYCAIMSEFSSATMSTLFGTMVVVLMSRILAVYMRCPITIFLVSVIFPMIPGVSIYNTTYYVVVDDLTQAAITGVSALKIVFAITLGIVFVVSMPKEWFVWERLMKKLYTVK